MKKVTMATYQIDGNYVPNWAAKASNGILIIYIPNYSFLAKRLPLAR